MSFSGMPFMAAHGVEMLLVKCHFPERVCRSIRNCINNPVQKSLIRQSKGLSVSPVAHKRGIRPPIVAADCNVLLDRPDRAERRHLGRASW